jgi:hypothetical protein
VPGNPVPGDPVLGASVPGHPVQAPPGGTPERNPSDTATGTGDPQVEEALESLADLLERPLAEQVEVYAAVHLRLQDRLADLDE